MRKTRIPLLQETVQSRREKGLQVSLLAHVIRLFQDDISQ